MSAIQVIIDVGIGFVAGLAVMAGVGHLLGWWKWRGKGFPRSR